MTDASVTWSDERVEQLKRLWSEGRSASQIAAEIGGVSRNAVIGKVHRLGLSGRSKTAPASSGTRPRGKAALAAKPAGGSGQGEAEHRRVERAPEASAHVSVGATALAQPRPLASEPALRPRPVAEVVAPVAERVTIMDLREGMCRWPMGDPTSPEFRFCGARSSAGAPYCQHHAQIAYQPAADRRREKKAAQG